MAGRLLVGVDGGQTSTKAIVATPDGAVLGRGQGGPSDHFHSAGGVAKNRAAIHGAIGAALSAAGATPAEIGAVALGLTGSPPGGDQNPIVHEIVRELAQPRSIVVTPDYVSNLAGASGGKSGVVLIAGGGSIGYGITDDGREAVAGGFGYLLGDEGSAFNIGLRAINAASRASDRRGDATALEAIVLEHFGIDAMRTITQIVYRADFSRDRISHLAPKVVQAAHAGDAAAREILRDAGRELARIGLGVIRQLYRPGEAPTVYLTGGVFGAGEIVQAPFREALREGWPPARPESPRFPPVVGALILAARAGGVTVEETWLATVEITLAEAAA
jgi:N-acetylglucosamine kinase-like BadF-type ATPase